MEKSTASAWVLGIVMGLLAFLGIIMASRAADPIFYGTGLTLCAFGVLFVFVLIKQNTE